MLTSDSSGHQILDMNSHNPHRGKKLTYYFNGLSHAEKGKFNAYLESSILGNSRQGVEILAVLEQKLSEGELASLQPEWFASIMIPEEPMNEKKIHYIWVRLSVFQEKLLEFLSFLEYQQDRTAQNRYVLQACKNRGQEKYIPSLYAKSLRALPKAEGAHQFLAQLELELLLNEYLSDHATQSTDTHLAQVSEKLDAYFIVQKLKYACAAENEQLMWGKTSVQQLLAPVIQHLETTHTKSIPAIQAYLHAYQMLHLQRTDPTASTEHYRQLFELLKHQEAFAKDEAKDLFTYAQNFCILQVQGKQLAFLSDLKTLMDRLLSGDLLLDNGLLAAPFYKNTVTLMCRFGEFDWAESFIETYKRKLSQDPEQLAYLYNRAVLHFHKKEYAQVVKELYHRIHLFEHLSYGIGARIYLCKALWEQMEFEWLLNMLNAFKQYLYRNKALLARDKSRHNKFVRLFSKIVKAKAGNPGKRELVLRKIQDRMEVDGDLGVYPWLKRILVSELGV